MFTGELVDANDLVYLRARYYHPGLGVFMSLDPVEGVNRYQYVGANPVNDAVGELGWMNGYAYVNSNPVNLTDSSGMIAESPATWNPCFQDDQQDCSCYSDSWAYLLCRAGKIAGCQPDTPEPPCNMREQNGVNVLAAMAFTETGANNTASPLTENNLAVAALMIMQVNNFRSGGWKTLGTWAGIGHTPLTIVAPSDQVRLIDIATLMVDGYCASEDPLALFTTDNYPEIAGSEGLREIATNPLARNEISINASRAEQFRNDPAYPVQFVVTAEGFSRAVVIGTDEITRAFLDYQCPLGENAVLTDSPDVLGRPLSQRGKYECKECNRATRHWWWSNTGSNYELLSEVDFQRKISTEGGHGYVASCTKG